MAGSIEAKTLDFFRREFEDLEPTNWWIVTGGPSCGKSALLKNLAQRGYRTMSEAARDHIDAELAAGRKIDEIRGGPREDDFQMTVFDIKQLRERQVSNNELVI